MLYTLYKHTCTLKHCVALHKTCEGVRAIVLPSCCTVFELVFDAIAVFFAHGGARFATRLLLFSFSVSGRADLPVLTGGNAYLALSPAGIQR